MSKARELSKLLSGTLKVGALQAPAGTTAQRPSGQVGQIRYNSTTGKNEVYDSSGWGAIAAPPLITTVSPSTYNGEAGTQFTINGSFFDVGASVKFIDNAGVEYTAATVTRNNAAQLLATTPQDFTVAQEPLKVKVLNPSGLSYILDAAIDCGGVPAWNTAAGSLGTCYDSMRMGYYVDVSAGDPDVNSTITYSIASGTLPSGMSLNTSTGRISGTPNAVGADTTSNFVLSAIDNAGNTTQRSFNITIKAPVIEVFTYTGATQTWNKPTGVTSVLAKLWGAAGGAGTSYTNTYGGPGGFGTAKINVSNLNSLNIVVGEGGKTPNGQQTTYGHLLNSTDGLPGGFGASCGGGGGLSGIFNGAVTAQANAIAICGGGGGSGQNATRLYGAGGAGGGLNQNGDDGYNTPNTSNAHGRGGTLSTGGLSGLRFYVNPNGVANVSVATDGSALCGGHAHTISSWTEGGGGGSGYYGGGSGSHEDTGAIWGTAGGGSGYANTSYCSSIVAYKGTYEAQSSQATSDANFANNAGVPIAGSQGGHGRVVLIY